MSSTADTASHRLALALTAVASAGFGAAACWWLSWNKSSSSSSSSSTSTSTTSPSASANAGTTQQSLRPASSSSSNPPSHGPSRLSLRHTAPGGVPPHQSIGYVEAMADAEHTSAMLRDPRVRLVFDCVAGMEGDNDVISLSSFLATMARLNVDLNESELRRVWDRLEDNTGQGGGGGGGGASSESGSRSSVSGSSTGSPGRPFAAQSGSRSSSSSSSSRRRKGDRTLDFEGFSRGLERTALLREIVNQIDSFAVSSGSFAVAPEYDYGASKCMRVFRSGAGGVFPTHTSTGNGAHLLPIPRWQPQVFWQRRSIAPIPCWQRHLPLVALLPKGVQVFPYFIPL